MIRRFPLRLLTFVFAALCLAAPVYAGPGGQIAKGLFYTPWGRLLLGVLAILLAPVIIYVMVQERRAGKRALADLAVVARCDSAFDWLKVQRRMQECFSRVHHAWNEGDVSEAEQWMTAWYWQNQQLVHLDDWKKRGLTNVCEVKRVKSIKPLLFVHRNERNEPHRGSELIVSIDAHMTDYLMNQATGQVEEGDKKPKDVTRVWSFIYDGTAWKVGNIEEDSVSLAYAKLCKSLPPIETTLLSAPTQA